MELETGPASVGPVFPPLFSALLPRIKFDTPVLPFILKQEIYTTMADVPPPNPSPVPPTGAVMPPKKETGKVQPKKETVRINLPPKPTAAPTIKLPTLPPGGPTGAPSMAPAAAPAPAAIAAPKPAASTAAPAPVKGAPPAAGQRPAPIAQRPAAPIVPTIKPLDKILIYTAVVASLLAVGGTVWVFLTIKNTVESFVS